MCICSEPNTTTPNYQFYLSYKYSHFKDLFDVTKKQFGQIDIVVNNAGIMDESRDMLLLDINLVIIHKSH